MRPGADTWIHIPVDLTEEEWRAIRRLNAKVQNRAAKAAQAAARAEQAIEGLRANLLAVLELRGLTASDALRDRISTCDDPLTLQRWFLQALSASRAEDVGG
jgi:hypothetical protein